MVKKRRKYQRSTSPKKCIQCGAVKPAEEFHSQPHCSSGLQARCKACRHAEKHRKCPRSAEPQTCTKCGEIKEASEFYAHATLPRGLNGKCKICCQVAKRRAKRYAPSTQPQKCKKCDEIKPAGEFPNNSTLPSGLKGRCKVCTQIDERLRKYGLDPKTHLLLLEAQNYVCICGEPLTTSSPVDHCHATGRIRNILCTRCNKGLGHFKDSPELLQKHADELRRHQQLEAQGISRWGYVPQ